jgi:hypothetical protein
MHSLALFRAWPSRNGDMLSETEASSSDLQAGGQWQGAESSESWCVAGKSEKKGRQSQAIALPDCGEPSRPRDANPGTACRPIRKE